MAAISREREGLVVRGWWPHKTTLIASVELQQLAERVVVSNVGRPTVRGSHSRVKGVVCVGEPLRAGVVELRQGALLKRLCGGLVAGNRTLRVWVEWVDEPVAG